MYMSVDSPSDAAASFIKEACLKRKGILDKAIQYCTQVLNHDVKPEVKDGALHLIGTVCNILLKDKVYKVCFFMSWLLTCRNNWKTSWPLTFSRCSKLRKAIEELGPVGWWGSCRVPSSVMWIFCAKLPWCVDISCARIQICP